MPDWTAFSGLAHELGIAVDQVALTALAEYLDELLRWRKAVNLVGPAEPQRIVDELLADALPLATVLTPQQTLLDVGAGAGLPGLVVASIRADVSIDLWEPRARRAAFLRAATQRLRLANVRTSERRLEAGQAKLPFDVLSARAVWPPHEWLELATGAARPGALVAVHIGMASPPQPPAGLTLEKQLPYRLPGDPAPRLLVLYRRA